MKFSERWLREWVSPALNTTELAEQITMAGLEVDSVDDVAGEFEGVVVGEVVECGRHPEADKLQVTKVDVGADERLDIVCGAPNCRQGIKVAVATVGAVLPGNFKIKKAKLRGQPSFGMLCSESELELSDANDGILELPLDAPIGADIREYLKLDDVTIEVDLTPNRADCLGIAGLAREVGVLNRQDVLELQVDAVIPGHDDTLRIDLADPQACPRYLGRILKNINPNASTPLWMVEKLRRCGVRSIDPVVDVTNYVLIELGHPMHAFDLEKLEGGIKVRMAEQGEKLTLLDGQEVELDDSTLVIADHQKAVAMAGIFGGADSGVNDNSQHIFLESAFFSPLAIAGRARRYGLHTDASHRYERGVDPRLQRNAMERATQLLLDIVGGEAGPITEAVSDPDLPAPVTIQLRRNRLERVLGAAIADSEVTEILVRIGCNVKETKAGWQAVSPSYRFDLAIEEDLIEEVARIYGYNNIENAPPVAKLTMSNHKEADIRLSRIKSLLTDLGYQEAITYSFVDPKIQALLHPDQNGLVLPYPISADMSVMRLSLWPGLLQAAKYNQNRQQQRVRLFETGLRFTPQGEGVEQTPVLAGVITGTKLSESWLSDNRKVDFFDLKGDIEALLGLTDAADTFRFEAADVPALHPGQSAALLVNDKVIGHLGALHPQLLNKLDLQGPVFMFEIVQERITQRTIPEAVELSRFPSNRRDIAILVEDTVSAGSILNFCQKNGANQLVGIDLFDVYRGKGVPEGKKSLAIALTLQDSSRTLEEADISAIVENIVDALSNEFGASLRD